MEGSSKDLLLWEGIYPVERTGEGAQNLHHAAVGQMPHCYIPTKAAIPMLTLGMIREEAPLAPGDLVRIRLERVAADTRLWAVWTTGDEVVGGVVQAVGYQRVMRVEARARPGDAATAKHWRGLFEPPVVVAYLTDEEAQEASKLEGVSIVAPHTRTHYVEHDELLRAAKKVPDDVLLASLREVFKDMPDEPACLTLETQSVTPEEFERFMRQRKAGHN